ncbi:DUF3795 domain-containing protein [Candidatus Bathyarchaeota archaeon]|nr:DUF3795 domain-containing protein [Candidatus Bathyarchaeota archaeon]
MPNLNLITRCGIYCGACYIYRAERDDGDFLSEVAKQQKSNPNEIKCNGCFAPNE